MKTFNRVIILCLSVGILNFSCAHKTYKGFFLKSNQSNYNQNTDAAPISVQLTETPILEANAIDQTIAIQESPAQTAAKGVTYTSKQPTFVQTKIVVSDSTDTKKSKKQNTANSSTAKTKDKSQTAAFIIAFLSWFILSCIIPIHRFYLGGKTNVKNGIWMIVLGVLTFGIVTTVWGLIDVIRIGTGNLKPGNGEYNPKWQK